jgi:uncharacterized phage-associated protein
MQGFDYRKAVQSLNYLSEKEGGSINKMKAIKLLWLADRYHIRRYGRPILNDQYVAMKYGPVQSAVRDLTQEASLLAEEEVQYRDEFLQPKGYEIKTMKPVDSDVFSESDIEALEAVYSRYGKLDKFALAELSHRYPEWKKFEEQFNAQQGSRFFMNWEDFFKNPDDGKDDFFAMDLDHLELSKETFIEHQKLC